MTAPPVGSLPEVLGAARTWLLGLARREPEVADGTSAASAVALLGITVTEAAGGAFSAELRTFAQRVCRRRGATDHAGGHPGLPPPSRPGDRSAVEVGTCPDPLAATRWHVLGVPAGVPGGPVSTVPPRRGASAATITSALEAILVQGPDGPYRLLRADPGQTREVCRAVRESTRHGSVTVPLPAGLRAETGAVLGHLLVAALRRDDLDLGAMLMRAYLHLGAGESPPRPAASALLARQHPHGYFQPLRAPVLKEGDGRLDPDLNIHLPLTASCLWSLAEALIVGFRLAAGA